MFEQDDGDVEFWKFDMDRSTFFRGLTGHPQPTNTPTAASTQPKPSNTSTAPNSATPPSAELVQSFMSIYPVMPQPFNAQFSLLPLRDELNFITTCWTIYKPFRQNAQQVMQLFKSGADFNATLSRLSQRTLDRYTVSKLTSDHTTKPVFNENGFGDYTLRQIGERQITLGEAQKLRNFVDTYHAQHFADKNAQTTWLTEQISQDETLAKHFSPGHACWPQLRTLQGANPDLPLFDLELALLSNSPGVQKYAAANPSFYNRLIHVAKQSSKIDCLKDYLDAFNNPVIQEYLDENKISVLALIQQNSNAIELLKNPTTKKYYDEGHFDSIADLLSTANGSENLLLLLRSPIIRTAYENQETNWDELCDMGSYMFDLFDPDEACPRYDKELLSYLTEGLLKFDQFRTLTEQQRNDLTERWVKPEIKAGNLTMEDVLGRSLKFYGILK